MFVRAQDTVECNVLRDEDSNVGSLIGLPDDENPDENSNYEYF